MVIYPTLGYVGFDTLGVHLFSFTEATIGLMLVAMLIAYLPTMYSAFQQREAAVSLLEVRAGSPPNYLTMRLPCHSPHALATLDE